MIRVAHPRLKRCEQLTDDDDCGVAGVVVDVLQARFHGLATRVLKDSHIEPRAPEQGLEEAEVDGRHLRGKNFVSRIAHFLGEDGPRFNVSGLDLLGFFARGNGCGVLVHSGIDRSRGHGSSFRNRRFQGTQADFRGTKVRYFVDLEDRVHVAASLKDFLDLVGGDCVNAAAEGVELDHLKVRLIAHAGGGLV